MTKPLATATVESVSFVEILHAAGARIWPDDAIRAYMEKERSKYRPNWLWYLEEAIISAVILLIIVGALSFVITLTIAILSRGWWLPAEISAGIVMLGVVGFLFSMSPKPGLTVLGHGYWHQFGYSEYSGVIPLAAQRLVNEIRMLAPDTDFRIDVLKQSSWAFDPVLWAIPAHTPINQPLRRYALIVWDESGNIVPPPS